MRALHDRFGQAWVGMNRSRKRLRRQAVLDRQDALHNQIAGMRAKDMQSEHLAGLRLGNYFYQAIRVPHRYGLAIGGK